MGWAQVASAKQMCDYSQAQLNISVDSTDTTDNDDDNESFFLRGPIEEEIHHPTAFFYGPCLSVIYVISFPHLKNLTSQVYIFDQIKPPSFS